MKLIGLDIGTTSVCGVLMDAETGQVARTVSRPNRSGLESPRDWEFIQDAAAILRTVEDVARELREGEPDIGGIGVTGQMHGIVYVDERGIPVSPLYTWQDQRGDLLADGDVSYVERLRRLTGYSVATGYGMATHYYHVATGTVPAEAASFCTIPDFVAARLAGRSKPATDPTNAASLGLYRLDALAFDAEALAKAGIDPALLPEPVRSGAVIGATRDGIPVACAIGDNQASFLGSVGDIRKSLLVNVGTGSQISAYTEEYGQWEEIDTRPFPGGGYLLVGASLSGGKSYALLERFFRETGALFAGAEQAELYEIMNRLAEEPPADGTELTVRTRFFGTRADPRALGAIENIGPANFTPRHLVHGFLEGMIAELRRYYDAFPAKVKEWLDTIVASGNGVRRNRALCRRLERSFGYPLEVPAFPEEAACGAALSAGVGCGAYPDFGRAGAKKMNLRRSDGSD
ncbi:sedoheptulokinase [Cohnella caldifontis]|uniref:sedoheptulokinase n=1 Tax=Cohnella caldifontis TaxID=3027471 RepID=UPI0023EBCEAD|nr:FGGY family carbohydrate kinase [Cohnella sp. YIM B05605]